MTAITRRRFVFIAAGAAIGGMAWSRPGRAMPRASWRGVSLGAEAQIVIDHADRDAAEECLAACRKEIERLEREFSLYRADSALARLNATGRLDAPSGDFLATLSLAADVHAASEGAFDPTVQPLWVAYAQFHSEPGAGMEPDLHDALSRIGLSGVHFDGGGVSFARPGMALTLNGIAQGYITDRITELLRARGFRNVLVELGEIRALGPQRDGTAWPVRISGSDRIVGLVDRAIATSATLGTTFDAAGKVGHILDPQSGRPASPRRQITVSAPTAALADALSTALCVAPERSAAGILARFPDATSVTTF